MKYFWSHKNKVHEVQSAADLPHFSVLSSTKVPTIQIFDDEGMLLNEIWSRRFNKKDSVYHRLDGPAVYSKIGNILELEWYVNGSNFNADTSNPASIEIIDGVVTYYHFNNMKEDSHRIGGPATYQVKDSDGLVRQEYEWFIDGINYNPNGRSTIEYKDSLIYKEIYTNAKGVHHREDGPAFSVFTENTIGYRWYIDGKLSRTDGPADIVLEPDTKFPLKEMYYLNNKKHRRDSPAIINNANNLQLVEFFTSNKMNRKGDLPSRIKCERGRAGKTFSFEWNSLKRSPNSIRITFDDSGSCIVVHETGDIEDTSSYSRNSSAYTEWKDNKLVKKVYILPSKEVCTELYAENGNLQEISYELDYENHREIDPARIEFDHFGKAFPRWYNNGRDITKQVEKHLSDMGILHYTHLTEHDRVLMKLQFWS